VTVVPRPYLAAAAIAPLLLTVPVRALDYAVSSTCDYALKSTDEGQMLLVVVATAMATGPAVAATTSVTCTAETVYRETVTATATSAGPRVYAASGRYMRYDPPVVCSTSEALWVEGTTLIRVTEEEHCAP
jgi:hypothetical protein